MTARRCCLNCAHWTPYACALAGGAKAIPVWGWSGDRCGDFQHKEVADD